MCTDMQPRSKQGQAKAASCKLLERSRARASSRRIFPDEQLRKICEAQGLGEDIARAAAAAAAAQSVPKIYVTFACGPNKGATIRVTRHARCSSLIRSPVCPITNGCEYRLSTCLSHSLSLFLSLSLWAETETRQRLMARGVKSSWNIVESIATGNCDSNWKLGTAAAA